MPVRPLFLLTAVLLFSIARSDAAAQASRPNVLVILVDDMGFSDLGCYGSEIETPNLDRLAANGLRLTQFYNTAKCHSSRISLLTGRYPFQAGNIELDRAVTAAEALKQAGYFTAMTGKWQLKKQPTDFGFDRYFGHLSGSTNYYLGDNTFRLNGQPFKVPEQGFYTTIANVDYGLKFLEEARGEQKPWFLYIAFNAPHAPLQPLEQDYKKYLGRYEAGWDVARAARVRTQQELNLFSAAVEPCPRPEHVAAWDSLPPEMQFEERRRMAAYAGIIDRIDQEVGRLVNDLRQRGELDNTLFVFCSDNGACPFGRRPIEPGSQPYDPTTHWGDSTGWAWMRNSPFRLYKQNQHEGGIASPAIIHWPAGQKAATDSISNAPAHLVDLVPTISEVTGAALPASWPGREVSPVAGVSLTPLLRGEPLRNRPGIFLQFGTNRGLRDGDWKIVSFKGGPWELYDLSHDRAELQDLATHRVDIRDKLAAEWDRLASGEMLLPERMRRPVSKKTQPYADEGWTDFGMPPKTPKKGKNKAESKTPAE